MEGTNPTLQDHERHISCFARGRAHAGEVRAVLSWVEPATTGVALKRGSVTKKNGGEETTSNYTEIAPHLVHLETRNSCKGGASVVPSLPGARTKPRAAEKKRARGPAQHQVSRKKSSLSVGSELRNHLQGGSGAGNIRCSRAHSHTTAGGENNWTGPSRDWSSGDSRLSVGYETGSLCEAVARWSRPGDIAGGDGDGKRKKRKKKRAMARFRSTPLLATPL